MPNQRFTGEVVDVGEFVALTRTSGSGKSTLFSLLGALDLPSAGSVRILGQDTSTLSEFALTELRARSVGFVFQLHFLLGELTAAENAARPIRRAGVASKVARDRAMETLEILDIAELADRRPPTMSGGQQQRVAIARAVAHRPPILLANEPTGSLDSMNTDPPPPFLRGDLPGYDGPLARALAIRLLPEEALLRRARATNFPSSHHPALRRARMKTNYSAARHMLSTSVLLLVGASACSNEMPEEDATAFDAADTPEGAATVDGAGPDATDETTADVGANADASEDTESDSSEDVDVDLGPPPVRDPAPEHDGVYSFAHGCYQIEAWAGRSEARFAGFDARGTAFAFIADDASTASRFRMQPTDLGTYLLYDAEQEYLVAGTLADGSDAASNGPFGRVATLGSDVELLDDSFRSPAEWELETSTQDADRFQLRHYQTGLLLGLDGLTDTEADSAVITLRETESCADFPELTLDASGTVTPRQWEDGSVYGIVEMHSHMLTNFGFGGGGVFHGGPFHRLGVQHALGSCEQFHGEGGRRDLMGSFYNGAIEFDVAALLPIVTSGQLDEHQHETDGYPEFTDWPNAWGSSTHQVMYYRWMERAYLSGMRLVIQHATGNSVLCDFMTGIGAQGARYSCNDMVSVDRSIAEIRNMERYIDAQSGGPGLGWFRVVESTEEAREVINAGKMAVVLGIEISNLFDCFLTPQVGFDICDADSVRADLDRYYDLGVRVVFPVHKYDNAFSPGDGWGGVTELGNVINSGHYTNMVEECPPSLSGQDSGNLTFGGLNRPRDDYFAPAPLDMSGFAEQPLATLLPIASDITEGGAPGNFCQNTGMTDLGETLLTEMMMRGMIPDIAHLPRQSVVRSLEMLRENDYPATSTHRATYDGAIYEIGGMSAGGIASCGRPDSPGSMSRSVLDRANQRGEAGYYPSEGISFDFNGFAGSRRPRFGENSGCSQPQENPVEYPFTSYDGDIEFTEPQLGDRSVDFNTEGMIHIGMLPELIEDARQDGATDEELEPLFRSAEAYLQMWERAETRGLELRDE